MADEPRTVAQIERDMKAATDVADILRFAEEYKGAQAVERKAALERVNRERAEATKGIVDPVRKLLMPLRDNIVRLGGVVRIVYEPENEELLDVSIGSKSTPRATVKGGAGRATGVAMDRFGKPLGALFEEVATAEERAAHDEADNNTKRWQIKKAAVKRATEAGELTPIS